MTTTTNLELKKPDAADRSLIGDINDNMDIIDEAVSGKVDAIEGKGLSSNDFTDTYKAYVDKVKIDRESTINAAALEELYDGTLMGQIASAIHGTADTYGVVRAYSIKSNVIIQIAEFVDGSRKTRQYANGAWSGWEASGGGGGGSYTKTLLYDSGNNVTGAPVGSTIELLDNLSNYDQGIVMCSTPTDRGTTPLTSSQFFFDVDYVLNDAAGVLHLAEYGYRWCQIAFTDSTFTVDKAEAPGESSGHTLTVYKIYGIKF